MQYRFVQRVRTAGVQLQRRSALQQVPAHLRDDVAPAQARAGRVKTGRNANSLAWPLAR